MATTKSSGSNPVKEVRVKNTGTTKGFGENGGATITNDNYRTGYGNIKW